VHIDQVHGKPRAGRKISHPLWLCFFL